MLLVSASVLSGRLFINVYIRSTIVQYLNGSLLAQKQVFTLSVMVIMEERESIVEAILNVANKRGPQKSTCPSEIARDLFPENWRSHMEDVRNVAIDLCNNGKIRITQKGEPINTREIKGPIRFKII